MSHRMPPYCSGFQNQSGRPPPPPASPPLLKDLVRRDVDGLDHLADRALPNQFACIDGRLHLKQLAVHDGVDALGLGNRLAHVGQLLQRRDARACQTSNPCRASWRALHAQWRALVGDLRTEDQLHRRIVENLVLRLNDLHVGESLVEDRRVLSSSPPQAATSSPPPRWTAPTMP